MFLHASIPCLPGLTPLLLPQVIDHSGVRLGEYEDVSKVEKYEISPEAYERRQSTERMGGAGRACGSRQWGRQGGAITAWVVGPGLGGRKRVRWD